MKDFKDAVQLSAAEFNEVECIITRNDKDFINSKLKILCPKDYIESLQY